MVGEVPAHNEAAGRDLYASLIGLAAGGAAAKRARRSGNASRWCWKVGRDGGLEAPVPADGGHRWNPRLVSTRSIQAVAPLAPGVSQQAFKHLTGIRVAGLIAARVTPIGKIPLDGASFGD